MSPADVLTVSIVSCVVSLVTSSSPTRNWRRTRDLRRHLEEERQRKAIDFHIGRGPDADQRLAEQLRRHPYEREEGDR